jgi:hypothetical protein
MEGHIATEELPVPGRPSVKGTAILCFIVAKMGNKLELPSQQSCSTHCGTKFSGKSPLEITDGVNEMWSEAFAEIFWQKVQPLTNDQLTAES